MQKTRHERLKMHKETQHFIYVYESECTPTRTCAQGQRRDCTGDRIFSKLFCFTNFHLDRNMLKANPRVRAQPSGGKVSVFPPPALGFCSWQSHNFKVKTEGEVWHTHTHILPDPSVPVFPHFLPCHPVGLFRPLWCIIEAVCNFTDSFPVESLSELNFHFSHRSGIFSLKWKDQFFEHAG